MTLVPVYVFETDGSTWVFYTRSARDAGVQSERDRGLTITHIYEGLIPRANATGGDVPDADAVNYVMEHVTP